MKATWVWVTSTQKQVKPQKFTSLRNYDWINSIKNITQKTKYKQLNYCKPYAIGVYV